MKLSTGYRNGALDGSAPPKTVFDGGHLRLFTGAAPADADAAETGTLLVSQALATPSSGSASGGVLTFTAIADTTVLADGTAAYVRIVASGDTGASSSTQARIQGSVSITGGGGDYQVNTTALLAGTTYSSVSLTETLPAS